MTNQASTKKVAAPSPTLEARYALAETGNLVALEAELKRTGASVKHTLDYNDEWFVDDYCQCAHGQGCPISKYRCIPCTVLSRGGNLKRDGPLRENSRHYQVVRSPMGHPRLCNEYALELRARYLLERVTEVPEYYGSFYCGGCAVHLMRKAHCTKEVLGVEASKLYVQLMVLMRKLHDLGFDLATVSGSNLELLDLRRCITVSGKKINFDFSLMMPRVDGLMMIGERSPHWTDDDYLRTLPKKQFLKYHAWRLILELAQRPDLIQRQKDWADFWGPRLPTANGCLSHKLRLPAQVMVQVADHD